ncbi:unnamed protein product [Moneuplotes crassus]|uniref:Uncharacterized protein n=1 Tax=Euplotes crassus TaxID=5936 RepID=A0AAD1X4F9_EUPCR|nr:unnamed protein product [Moneuplotes crassus]
MHTNQKSQFITYFEDSLPSLESSSSGLGSESSKSSYKKANNFCLPSFSPSAPTVPKNRSKKAPGRPSPFTKAQSEDCKTPSHLKLTINTKSAKNSCKSQLCAEEYLYILPQKSIHSLENKLNDFLTCEGVKQIHLQAAFEQARGF